MYRLTLAALLVATVTTWPARGMAQDGQSAPRPLDLRLGAAPSEGRTAPTGEPAPTATQRPATAPAFSRDYRVGAGDLIDVEVFDMDNLKRTVRVNSAGSISLPLIGQVAVAGLTAQEVEERIVQRYGEKYLQNPQVSIFIKEFTTERIAIEGAVARPGIYPLTGSLTLLRVLAIAGGFGPIANTSQVALYRVNDRREREMIVYDVEKIRAGQAEDPPIRGEDLIVVQRDSARAALKDSIFRDVIDTINPFSVLVPR